MSLNCGGSQTETGRACTLHTVRPESGSNPHPSFSKVTVLTPAPPCLPVPDGRTTSSTLQFLLQHSSPKRRAKNGMRGFSPLSPGFGKSLVEHWRSRRSTGRWHLSSVASGACKSSGCYQPIPLAVKEASAVGFEREKMAVCVWSTPKAFFSFFLERTSLLGRVDSIQCIWEGVHLARLLRQLLQTPKLGLPSHNVCHVMHLLD